MTEGNFLWTPKRRHWKMAWKRSSVDDWMKEGGKYSFSSSVSLFLSNIKFATKKGMKLSRVIKSRSRNPSILCSFIINYLHHCISCSADVLTLKPVKEERISKKKLCSFSWLSLLSLRQKCNKSSSRSSLFPVFLLYFFLPSLDIIFSSWWCPFMLLSTLFVVVILSLLFRWTITL